MSDIFPEILLGKFDFELKSKKKGNRADVYIISFKEQNFAIRFVFDILSANTERNWMVFDQNSLCPKLKFIGLINKDKFFIFFIEKLTNPNTENGLVNKIKWCVITEAYDMDLHTYLQSTKLYKLQQDELSIQLYNILREIAKLKIICLNMKPASFVIKTVNTISTIRIIDIDDSDIGCSTVESWDGHINRPIVLNDKQMTLFSLTYSLIFLANMFFFWNLPNILSHIFSSPKYKVMQKDVFWSTYH